VTYEVRTGIARIVLVALMAGLLGIGLSPRPVFALEEGHHLHVQIHNHPAPGKVIPRAPYTFHVTLIVHENAGRVTSFRVADYSTVKKTVPVSLGPCADCSVSFDFTVDFSTWSCGEHELRWTANIPDTFEGKRQFTTSRAYVMLQGCTTNRHGRTGWYAGGGSWYEGVDYSIVVQQSPFSSVVPGGTARWRVQSSANRGCLFLNPDAHNGSMGTQVGSCWSGTSTVSRTLPTVSSVGDRLAAYSEDSPSHAGLFVHRIGDAADGFMWMEWQSWWRTQGLSVP
jgi:hypothetical protein